MKSTTSSQLWYSQPANNWNAVLPIGNGRLGGMIFGGLEHEHLQLNEDSIWYGGPRDRNNPDALANLPTIRQLLKEGRIHEAEQLALDSLSGMPENQRHYEPFADLELAIEHQGKVSEYVRTLDLAEAIASVSYQIDEVSFQREYFASAVDQVIVVRLAADQPGKIHFRLRLRRCGRGERYTHYLDTVRPVDGCAVIIRGGSGGNGEQTGVSFWGGVRVVVEGGQVSTMGETVVVRNADAATIMIGCATDFYHQKPAAVLDDQLKAAAKKSYQRLRGEHITDYQQLYNRVTLELDDEDLSYLPTDERLQRITTGTYDLGLVALYFQFGRYLLIASSRPGTLPANLQGIWNDRWLPSWDSKYTININLQMNYWPAEICNLAELHEPLFELLERLREPGRRTARVMYGAQGMCVHHNTDIWADSAPQGCHLPSTYWPMGAAWLCTHLWEHYLFYPDQAFLKRAYPIMKEAAEFFVDFLIEDKKGRLVTCPSVSPENTYILPNGERGTLCIGPSMDSQILYALFSQCIETSEILHIDELFRNTLQNIRERLPVPSIGKHGQIMEWAEDYDEAELGHRHISHLWALHPGYQIVPESSAELAQAARITLERRLAHGGGHTGWSRAWIINFWARLYDGELAFENVQALLAQSTLPNLLDNHPPFQIDGNFGGTAGIAEMLLQSRPGEIRLLPALPSAWKTGTVGGLRARGALEINIKWEQGTLTHAVITAQKTGRCQIFYKDHAIDIHFQEGQRIILDPELNIIHE